MANNIEILDANSDPVTIATKDVGGVHYQNIAPPVSRSDTFTATGDGVTVDASDHPLQSFGLQVIGTGDTPSAWTVALQVSLDGTNWVTLLTHSSADSDPIGSFVSNGANLAPSLYLRSNVSALTLGPATNIVVTIVGMR